MVQGSDLLTGNVVTKRSVSGKSIRARLNSDQEVQPHVSSGAIAQKIPTAEDYGANVGRAISGLGNVFGNVLAKIGAQEEKNKFANARLDFENADRKVRDSIRENPELVDGAPDYYDQMKDSIVKKYGFEKDPDKQLYFTQRANTRVHHYADIKQKRAVEGFIANENSSIDKAVNAIVADPTPETRDRVLSSLDELVENSVGSYRTRAQALERKQELKDHLSLKYIEKLKETDPDKAEAELKAFKEGRVQANVDDQKPIDDKKPSNEKPIDGKQPKKINSQVPWDGKDIKGGIIEAANELGIDPVDLATAISYETAGTFNPAKRGPKTQWGRHKGLIQFGEPQAKKYGVDWKDPLGSQLGANGAVVKYLRAAGVKKGMGLLDIYSAINAGSVGRYNASDANNGGAPGTVRDKVNKQMSGHKAKAKKLLGDYSSQVAGSLQRSPVQTKRSKFVEGEITRLEKSIAKAQGVKREQEFIGGVITGEIKVTGNDAEAMKGLNKAFNSMFPAGTDFVNDNRAREVILQLAQNKAPMPKRFFQTMTGHLESDDKGRRLGALQLLSKVEDVNKAQFLAGPGTTKLAKDVETFRKLSEFSTPEEAVQKMMLAEERRSKMTDDQLKTGIASFQKELSLGQLEDIFDDSWLPWDDPEVGVNDLQKSQIMSDYNFLAKQAYMETGDNKIATAHAQAQLKKRWGVSEIMERVKDYSYTTDGVTSSERKVSGRRVVMKYPPEMFLLTKEERADAKVKLQEDVKGALSSLKETYAKQGLEIDESFELESDEITKQGAEAYDQGKTRDDDVLLMDGIGTKATVRETPTWRVKVYLKRNGERVDAIYIGRFDLEGLQQGVHDRKEARREKAKDKDINDDKRAVLQKEALPILQKTYGENFSFNN